MTANPWRCLNCRLVSDDAALLRAPNPFDPTDMLTGCPECKSVEGFAQVCDEPGCGREATCGSPVDGVYRRTCFVHSGFKVR